MVWILKETIYEEDYPEDWHKDEKILGLFKRKKLALEKARSHMKSRPDDVEGEYKWKRVTNKPTEKSWELYTKERFDDWFYENHFVTICKQDVES